MDINVIISTLASEYTPGISDDDIAELRRVVVERDRLRAENEELKTKIEQHNNAVESACKWMQANRGCNDYIQRGMQCPDCPKDWQIDALRGEGE